MPSTPGCGGRLDPRVWGPMRFSRKLPSTPVWGPMRFSGSRLITGSRRIAGSAALGSAADRWIGGARERGGSRGGRSAAVAGSVAGSRHACRMRSGDADSECSRRLSLYDRGLPCSPVGNPEGRWKAASRRRMLQRRQKSGQFVCQHCRARWIGGRPSTGGRPGAERRPRAVPAIASARLRSRGRRDRAETGAPPRPRRRRDPLCPARPRKSDAAARAELGMRVERLDDRRRAVVRLGHDQKLLRRGGRAARGSPALVLVVPRRPVDVLFVGAGVRAPMSAVAVEPVGGTKPHQHSRDTRGKCIPDVSTTRRREPSVSVRVRVGAPLVRPARGVE